jgi:hypothetical protein
MSGLQAIPSYFPDLIAGGVIGFTVRRWGQLLVGCIGWAFLISLCRATAMFIYYKAPALVWLYDPLLLTLLVVGWMISLIISLVIAAVIAAIRFAL